MKNETLKWWLGWTVIACLIALPVLAESPKTLKQKLDAWFTTAVNVYRTPNGDLVVADCFDGADKRVPEEFRDCLADLQHASPSIIAELRPEMELIRKVKPISDREALRTLMHGKIWSPTLMFELENMCGGTIWLNQNSGSCTTGRCDCVTVGCEPPTVCDCQTLPGYDPKGFPLPCQPPRKLCNITITKDPKTALQMNLW